ncbi:MAG: lysine 2,3-aminomutase [Pseudomonadota bacterium]|nr:lysine 2,3-aminomutase [Pseudomonadota bacterium]
MSPSGRRKGDWDVPFRILSTATLRIGQLRRLPEEQRFAMKVVASVLPFRVNDYVINELIDWDRVPDDPVFRLTFPQPGMLGEEDFARMADLHRRGADRVAIQALANELRQGLNPHPAGQLELNIPRENGRRLEGLQHKYRETLLFFPSQGQTCHSYCTFCFRWAQFVGDKELKIANSEAGVLHRYLRKHPQVTDLLMTGGDPMIMKSRNMVPYLEPLISREFDHLQSVRIGTKSLAFWPNRFITDADAHEMLQLLERLVEGGKHVAIMAHYNHPRELSTDVAREAIRRLRETGVEIRSQGPLLRHINDDFDTWAELWSNQVSLGIVPYYMFVERNTGAQHYFEVPLVRAWDIYRNAMQRVSGLGRTARGPSMSTGPGKVEVSGVTEINGEKIFVLRFIQGRDPDWVQRPFFAKFDPAATWLDQLQPAFGEKRFFFEEQYQAMKRHRVRTIDRR